MTVKRITNLRQEFKGQLLTNQAHKGHTENYWPKVITLWSKCNEVYKKKKKKTEGQFFSVQLEKARLVSSLLYGFPT